MYVHITASYFAGLRFTSAQQLAWNASSYTTVIDMKQPDYILMSDHLWVVEKFRFFMGSRRLIGVTESFVGLVHGRVILVEFVAHSVTTTSTNNSKKNNLRRTARRYWYIQISNQFVF